MFLTQTQKESYIEQYRGLCREMAEKRFAQLKDEVDFDDLFEVARIGLRHALRLYDTNIVLSIDEFIKYRIEDELNRFIEGKVEEKFVKGEDISTKVLMSDMNQLYEEIKDTNFCGNHEIRELFFRLHRKLQRMVQLLEVMNNDKTK